MKYIFFTFTLFNLFCHATESMEKIFDTIYQNNFWGDKESFSGTGSNLKITQQIRKQLPTLFKQLNIKSLLDAPCGDFNWMRHVDISNISTYIGADIVPTIIEENNNLYSNEKISFETLNIVYDQLPKVDLIFCRDCLVHLKFADIFKALKQFIESNSTYLVATTFTNRTNNIDLSRTGDWRTLNLQIPPFNLPKPIYIINENCTEADGYFHDKSLGVWKLSEIKKILNI